MKKLFVALMLTLGLAFNSFAALSTSDIDAIKTTIGTGLDDVSAISVAVFGVLAGIWGIRKVIKLMNRS
jgi:hypothetical protein